MSPQSPVRIGIGGPVGSGKTALVDALCKRLRAEYRLAVVTNDIFTREDMEFLVRSEALSADRIVGVQTGGCPHTPIRQDASMNFDAIDELTARFPDLDLVLLESGGEKPSRYVPPPFPPSTHHPSAALDRAGDAPPPATAPPPPH